MKWFLYLKSIRRKLLNYFNGEIKKLFFTPIYSLVRREC